MAKLEDILKQRGYSDADIQALGPMLTDQRFRSSLEASYGELETKLTSVQGDLDKWSGDWLNDANAKISRAEQETIKARREAADTREQLKLAKEWGLLEEGSRPDGITPAAPGVSATPGAAFDPKAHKLVTHDDIRAYAEAEGRAIAMGHDLSDEYRTLSGGKSLFEYEGANGARGMEALRTEAIAAKQDLRTYVASKFDFNGKRQAIATKRQEEHDAAIRKEAEDRVRGEMAAKFGNPNLRMPTQSSTPFIPPKPKEGGQPWEHTAGERRHARLERAMRNQVSGAVQ